MIFGLLRRSSNERLIDRLYEAVVQASRRAPLYADLSIGDTFEGRFESLTLHAVLVARRLRDAEAPGPDMAQHLIDTVFKHFDRTLREMGVGDTTVPKRMKTLAEAFLGRSAAYDAALRDGGEALRAALRRNVYMERRDADALARYVEASQVALAAAPLQSYMDGHVAFPEPADFAVSRMGEPEILP